MELPRPVSVNLVTSYFAIPQAIDPDDYEAYTVLLYISFAAIWIHLFFLVFFSLMGILPLVIFNIGSVAAWIIAGILTRRDKLAATCIIGGAEVLAHAMFCVMVLGWETGFQYYLITMAVGVFAVNKFYKIRYSLICAAIIGFVVSYFIGQIPVVAYSIDPGIVRFIYIANLVITFLVVVINMWFYSSTAYKAKADLKKEHAKAERLLHNILPVPIAARLKNDTETIADRFENATILFCDIVNFTEMSEKMEPDELVRVLNEIFCSFDRITDKYSIEKIKTIGDAYMVAAGVPRAREDHAEAVANFALELVNELNEINRNCQRELSLRIGINSGPLVAGVIGKRKFIYDLWGDTVNVASRMESTGLPDQIQVTENTYHLLKERYTFRERGLVEVKGKGSMMTYILLGKKSKMI